MVSVVGEPFAASLSRVRGSIDLGVRDLLLANQDHLALAAYLWAVSRHQTSLVNGDSLANWGGAQIRTVFIAGSIGRRADDEIASAALSFLALEDRFGAEERTAIVDGL